jgi:Arylsulfotransferase (ASST)
MRNSIRYLLCVSMLLTGATGSAAPSIYPSGTTIYDPSKAHNGYTVFISSGDTGGVLIDMNGNVVKTWPEFENVAGGPVRLLPGGDAIGPVGALPPHQESIALEQIDWDGNVVWRFDHVERVETSAGETIWAARQHHDWQREGFPAGYYSPSAEPSLRGGTTLVVTHQNHDNPAVTNKRLEDDRIIEVDWDGRINWEWRVSDHIDELGFSAEARRAIMEHAEFNNARGSSDWFHLNSATYVGPNRWFDAGDERFNPQNVIISSRQSNIIAIVARANGSIVWRMGPDYRERDEWAAIGQIIGQHHPHIIPKGLSGAGHLLVFDNGGTAGYGFANPSSPDGTSAVRRYFSRVLEIDPVTFEKVWEYSIAGLESYRFFSHYVSAAQRLENGNTLITEGADGRLFEVTPAGEIVWEYVSPFWEERPPRNMVYRAYRVPYEWVPQLARPVERRVVPPNVREFRVAPQ